MVPLPLRAMTRALTRATTGALLVASTLLLSGCQWPRDAEGTLERVRGGTVRVGVTESEPWVVLGGERPAGVEVRLVEALAARLDAEIVWVEGSESELMAALHVRALDLVVGGLSSTAPWTDQASLTRVYLRTRTVIAVPEGSSPAADLAGAKVAVERGTADAERVRARDVVPVPVDDIEVASGPVVVAEWRLDELGLVATAAEVTTTEHVVAVPLGESGWQVIVEDYLLERPRSELDRLLDEEQP